MRFADWSLPWPVLRLPEYRPVTLGHWALKHVPSITQYGYFQDWQGIEEMDALFYDEVTWMSTARDEIDSQAPHVATAFGHVVVMGAGMGVVIYNLLPMPQVERVTLVERDPQVIELLRQSNDFEQWPKIEKLQIEILDALEYHPARLVDHLYVDIWPTAGEAQASADVQRIQSQVRARQLGWWGQELHFLDWLKGAEPSLSAYQIWAAELNLPVIEQDSPAYIEAIKRVNQSYFYRCHRIRQERQTAQQPKEKIDMLENYCTHSAFVQQLNTPFMLEHESLGIIPLELVSVSDLRETRRQRMFSILFRGPLEAPFQQGIFPLKHGTLGNASLFLVPVAREADGMRYEAVFNQLVK
jgi:hypothetical protein